MMPNHDARAADDLATVERGASRDDAEGADKSEAFDAGAVLHWIKADANGSYSFACSRGHSYAVHGESLWRLRYFVVDAVPGTNLFWPRFYRTETAAKAARERHHASRMQGNREGKWD